MAESSASPTVFLSYSHADAAIATKLAAALGNAGYTVWWDSLIEGGARFSARIREALDKADVVVVLWSRNSIESDWVCDEASQGRDRSRLVPLSIDGSKPPLGFRQYQTINFKGWRGSPSATSFVALEGAIGSVVGGDRAKRRAAGPAATPMVSRRAAMAMGGGALVAVAGLGAWQAGLIGGGSEEHSIAVLPFRDLGGSGAQDFLAAGMTEQVRSALSRIAALKVLAGTSSDAAQKETTEASAIAAKLGVAYLLDGSVQRAGDRVRVAINLSNGKTGFSEWSQTLDRQLSDVFALQNEIARLVATAMTVRVATAEPAHGGTRNVRAYEELLKGRKLYLAASGEESDRAAMAHFEVAIAADPQFALARAALSRVLASLAADGADAAELKGFYERAIAEATKAVELAPSLPEAHIAKGYALWAGRLDMKGAQPSYDKAAELGAGDADIMSLYAYFAARTGRASAARGAIERALALDPLNPRTWRGAGSVAINTGNPVEAVAKLDRALALNPKMTNARALKAYALMLLDKPKEARAALEGEPSNMFRLTALGMLGARTGNRALAETSLAQLVKEEGDAALYQQAEVLAQMGRKADALDRLERARAVGDSGLTLMKVDPFLEPLRGEPRYRSLLTSIGFA
jgi:TolB-like protein/Flp pilus assembly protein TadD